MWPNLIPMNHFDNIWLLLCTFLVLLMQAGFCGLEIGLVRTKNSINVALKNLMDFCLACFVFWVIGFGLLFGSSFAGFIGTTDFFFSSENPNDQISIFLYQMAFCGTAATIISGAVSERTTFKAYLILTLVVSGIIYPIFGPWAWAGNVITLQSGWLQELGFIDFAGATVVHSIGGWTALAAIIIIGPRIGRFNSNINIQKSNPAISSLGILIMFIAWLGFNGGGFLQYTDEVPKIIMNTVISGISGGLFPIFLSAFIPRIDVLHYFSAVLAGLVSSTAVAPFINSGESALIGFIGAGLAIFGSLVLEKLKIDDVVQAVPVHAFAGVWGTLSVGLFGKYGVLGDGPGNLNQLTVQTFGALLGFCWAFGLGIILFWTINKLYPMRVSSQSEMKGLNISEHGSSSDLQDFLHAMELQNIPVIFQNLSLMKKALRFLP